MSSRSSEQFAVDDLRLREKRDAFLVVIAEPLIRNILRLKLRNFRPHSGVGRLTPCEDDLAHDVLVELTRKLNASPPDSSLWDAEGFIRYAARAAENRWHDLLRDDLPGRERLRLKLRRILTTQPSFAMWKYGGRMICGFAAWRGRNTDPMAPARLEKYAKDLSKSSEVNAGLLFTILNEAGGPLVFEQLINLIAEGCGAYTGGDVSLSDAYSRPGALISKGQNDEGLERDDVLRAFWKVMEILPVQQRLALMLTFTDAVGDSWLQHILYNRIATVDEVSRVLGMDRLQIEEIGPDLPLDYGRAAELLGTSRTNARKLRHRGWKSIEEHFSQGAKIFPLME